MNESQEMPAGSQESELLRQIRAGRKFSLSDAIGQMAGGDLMKGASPVVRKRQAELEIENYLEIHLADSEGALQIVLSRQIRESEIVVSNFDEPLVALADFIQRVIRSDYNLKEFVREVDAEWGRIYGERPHFDQAGGAADLDDPYTPGSVRATLTQLLEQLPDAKR